MGKLFPPPVRTLHAGKTDIALDIAKEYKGELVFVTINRASEGSGREELQGGCSGHQQRCAGEVLRTLVSFDILDKIRVVQDKFRDPNKETPYGKCVQLYLYDILELASLDQRECSTLI